MLPNRTVIAAALSCMFVTAAFAADSPKPTTNAQKKENSSRITSIIEIQPTSTLSDDEMTQVSFAAGRILKHVEQARVAIMEQKNDVASRHIDQGLKLVAIIESLLPYYTVKTEIISGEQCYADEDKIRPRYISLYDELERRDIISPIAQAKSESQQDSQKHPGTKELSPPAGVAVSHVDVNHTSAKLDLLLANSMLGRAKKSLQEGKADAADQTLLVIQSRAVLFEYEEIDLPLEEAADNLKLAEMEMKEGRVADAKAALHVAIDQLKKYEKQVGDHRSAEVKAMHEEITKLTNELEKGKLTETDKNKATGQISQWWHGATKWFKGRTK